MSSSSGRRRFHVRRHPVVVDIGCSCRRPKLSSLFNFSSLITRSGKSSNSSKSSSTTFDPFSPSTSLTTTITNSSFSLSNNDTSSPSPSHVSPKKKKTKARKKKKAVVEESVAVEKVSSDPYLDFKDSMLQMIVEKEIYQWEELRELLHLFLSLNSPYHHQHIIRAFTEIWNGIFSSSAEQ